MLIFIRRLILGNWIIGFMRKDFNLYCTKNNNQPTNLIMTDIISECFVYAESPFVTWQWAHGEQDIALLLRLKMLKKDGQLLKIFYPQFKYQVQIWINPFQLHQVKEYFQL